MEYYKQLIQAQNEKIMKLEKEIAELKAELVEKRIKEYTKELQKN